MQCGKPNYKPIPNVSINGWYKPSPNGRFIDSFLVLPHYSNYPLFIHIHPLLLAIPLLFIHYCSLYHYYLSIIVGYTTIIYPLLLAIPLLFIHYCWLYHYYLSIIVRYTTIIYPLLLAIPLLFIHYCWLYHYYLSIIVGYTIFMHYSSIFIHYCWLYTPIIYHYSGIGSTTSIGFATAEPKSNMNHMMAVLADTKIHQQQTLQIKI